MTLEDKELVVKTSMLAYLYQVCKESGPNSADIVAKKGLDVLSSVFEDFSDFTQGNDGYYYWKDLVHKLNNILE